LARKAILSTKMFDAESVSANTESKAIHVELTDLASINLTWSASSLVATAEVQAKNGKDEDWRALDMGGAISISGASGSHELVFNELPFTELRLALDVSSGSGTVDAAITTKSKGA
jgi:hypothetical protein